MGDSFTASLRRANGTSGRRESDGSTCCWCAGRRSGIAPRPHRQLALEGLYYYIALRPQKRNPAPRVAANASSSGETQNKLYGEKETGISGFVYPPDGGAG